MTHSKKLSTGLRLTMEGQKTPIEIATKGWSAKTIMNTLIKKTNAKDERTLAPPKLPWYKAESLPSSRAPVVKKVLVESKAAAAE
ncbi:hypothetical protein SARC_05638 [Sphaeroforma arctica JP610]|uniref:Uncharacterized protein n=1 Tax=Sphaeroforma arctica JP610 TaxID=667725 RepID=A0A0L0FZU1_9EUKA|nr:hypothetical protein SARC_05638 [Sphaeroforma arctica JP610]KNC82066.1 hypothetical protein SARC_05638 [Sphaeroforma arctica JP610]|eukprot:XP_014155968.1 hypothetical protein SARC_05638 [Sphaeroforma arctica JP610]